MDIAMLDLLVPLLVIIISLLLVSEEEGQQVGVAVVPAWRQRR